MISRVRRSNERLNFTVLDLFSGCGGLTEGFASVRDRPARLIPIAAVELDRFAAATYASNFGPHVHQGDISDWIGTGIPAADVVVGGPPCQGFSALGKRDPDDHRNKLWARYAEVVATVRPLYFVLENVSPFLRSEQFQQLEKETQPDGELRDYTLEGSPMEVIASEHGAAQKRRRAVVVGRLRDLPPIDMAKATHHTRTVRDAIDGTRTNVTTKELPQRTTTVKIANGSIETPGVFFTSDLHLTRNFTDLSLRRFAAIKVGGNRHDLPTELRAPCWLRHHDGSHDVMGRLHWERPSVTIRTEFWKPEKGRYLHPVADRPITHMEAALLQGFPPEFRWCGTKVSIGRQIGNAVPVELGRAIASALLDALEDAAATPRR
jgi:DNA (cytosine-5)-methyltransferase 1